MSQKRDYYDVLGIAKNATEAEIKSAYRKLALKCSARKSLASFRSQIIRSRRRVLRICEGQGKESERIERCPITSYNTYADAVPPCESILSKGRTAIRSRTKDPFR